MLETAGREASDPLLPGRRPKAQNTQPLEPILFPKLRIYFADFPAKQLAIVKMTSLKAPTLSTLFYQLEAFHLGDLLRL